MTVHSRLNDQYYNDHWKDRAFERANIDLYDPEVKNEILSEIKQLLKNPDNI